MSRQGDGICVRVVLVEGKVQRCSHAATCSCGACQEPLCAEHSREAHESARLTVRLQQRKESDSRRPEVPVHRRRFKFFKG